MAIQPNKLGYYAEYADQIPNNFKKILLQKEDRYFYYHFGLNPLSLARAAYQALINKKITGSSTINQQLVKILSNHENQRNWKNKIKEAYLAIALETQIDKEEILNMYANTIYLGNSVQGLNSASQLYFNRPANNLTDSQILRLIATIPNPTLNNPFLDKNARLTADLLPYYSGQIDQTEKIETFSNDEIASAKKVFYAYIRDPAMLEIDSLGLCLANSPKICQLTIDKELTAKLRDFLKGNLTVLAKNNTANGAITVIKEPQNELLAIIGTPDPTVDAYGYKINMAVQPRPIGSTVKPFIYLQAFARGLRPYTLVDDREYKYIIDSGFALYPKNYDYLYRGIVSLHYALSNSLNVPTVKTLEYVGLNNFYNFLSQDLKFKPIAPLPSYQLGIALGGLEMDLLSLSYYFSIFPNYGWLKPLTVYANNQTINYTSSTPNDYNLDKKIADPQYVQLINKILSDRLTGVEEFGLKSNLNLPAKNYGVKTGTSRDWHDSWTIGYTPDFLVGVWVGNSDNTAMDNISGSLGAGQIWAQAMNYILSSKYNQKTDFNFNLIASYNINGSLDWGLPNEKTASHLNRLLNNDLITNPHNNDVFLWSKNTQIILRASQKADWQINNRPAGQGTEVIFSPSAPGTYAIFAQAKNTTSSIKIIFNQPI
ncbi:MAG: hypothetical protein COU31_04635 [Candidatus Magasanikbacteria bacterium CG10_big_fil_rev_8_21_14_0_10_40_10]|uniref:peptidoglycan glycosyltransferase n=1 Tax=Candidatus Magasanikbacteria bacterium CG10_big_fil_rev_8_21_14_0_10_40_10 TaxID=1974648 RepID=A0A2M6W325_9BACT|nr:MAG: hypothetical protein COU31_04635 [Candidatus Magasanikbacteria bacterium CG10_big_fil_rev_8_21_14_0_10_40_10]